MGSTNEHNSITSMPVSVLQKARQACQSVCSSGIKAAGIKAAGIKAAGVKAEGIKAAGIKAAGIKAAGIMAAGIKATFANMQRLVTDGMILHLEWFASMVSESTDALSVQILGHLISLGLEGTVHNDGGDAFQGLLLEQLQNSPSGGPSC